MSSTERMPAVFVGHGNPMNAIEDNEFSRTWTELGVNLPRPEAILCVSAHWFIKDSRVLGAKRPRTIHDFYGFPAELYQTRYEAPGAPELAASVSGMVVSQAVWPDSESWGLDHGTWSVLRRMYPAADIPVSQLALNFSLPSEVHYRTGQELAGLRDQGVLIIGSGNMVHNLGLADWMNPSGGYRWADEFDSLLRTLIEAREDDKLVHYERLGEAARLSVPTPDHYWPLLYVLGAAESLEPLYFFNEYRVYGSVSMTGLVVG